jgi:thioredoxin 1
MEDNGMEVTITTANFDEKVIKSDKPVMLDFWASWCGPCRMVAPIIEKLAEDFNGKAVVGKVNVDEEQELAEKFKVMNIPTIFIMKGGQVVEKLVGARSERELQLLLEKYL